MIARRFLPLFALLASSLSGCECGPTPNPDAGLDGAIPGGDGGPTGPRVTICPGDALPSLPSGACEAMAGDANLLITGDVLTPGEVLRGGQVLVGTDGRITCVACDCSATAGAAGASRVVCPDGVISPGLINGHEHTDYVAGPPRMTDERYEHRQQWREGLDGHNDISAGGSSGTAAIQWDELREAMSGTTAGNTNGGRDGFVRNLDEGNTEGLGPVRVNYQTFILGDFDGDRPMAVDCNYDDLPSASDATRAASYSPHIAEGIANTARNEYLCVREGASDVITPSTAVIHGVGLLAGDIAEMAAEGSSLIWSPRTNISLYGDTSRVTVYDNQGVLIALGTDWMRSGSMNMLRELQCADDFNRAYLDTHFSDEELWLMATRNPAVVLAYGDVIGTLAPGLYADIAIFDARTRADHRAVLRAEPEDVALVLRAGAVLFGDRAVVDVLEAGCDAIDVCGQARAACVQRELAMSYSALAGANSSTYPLFFCDAVPTDEPTCLPSRNAMPPFPSPEVNGSNRYTGVSSATDTDGDGIANEVDICARVFNPIRPLDNGAQADFDTDGLGDECDPCPLDADTTTCQAVNVDDRDRDGVNDSVDNCPGVSNADQADGDADGAGNACDACPDQPNPGGAACPATIYDVKDATLGLGARVAITRSVVTALTTNGFHMQVPTDHPHYDGPDFSGVFVLTGEAPARQDGTLLARGDTIDVEGAVADYFGMVQLEASLITASAASSPTPAPVTAAASALNTGGARAAALEGVLVTVADVSVTNAAPPPTRTGGSAAGEFEVEASLRVDDFLFLIDPFVVAAETFASITGVMQFRDTRHKLTPRDADDYVAGDPALASLTPALSYVRQGVVTAAPTFPEPLTVTLTRAGADPTVVTVVASGAGGLVVMDVIVPAGMRTVVVPARGTTTGTFVVTATLGTDSEMADVRVLGATEAPAGLTISPDDVSVRSEGSQSFTVTLDIPAPPGGALVTLAETTVGTLPVPAEVRVAADARTATFAYEAPMGPVSGTLTATLDGTAVTAVAMIEVEPPVPGTLVINEIDYDQPSTDTLEFVELFNPGTTAVPLAGKQLVLVNQSGSQYRMIDLAGAGTSLPPGGFLVVRTTTASLMVAAGALVVNFPSASDQIQNGTDDGLLVYDATAMAVLDVLGYDGSTSTSIGGMTITLASELVDTGVGGLSRVPDGVDTDADTDWVFTTCITAGGPNVDASMMSCP